MAKVISFRNMKLNYKVSVALSSSYILVVLNFILSLPHCSYRNIPTLNFT